MTRPGQLEPNDPSAPSYAHWTARWRRRTGLTLVSFSLALSAAPLATAHATTTEARRSDPVRSGTVLNPAGYTGPATCTAAVDCLAWLGSGCDPRLAGQEPAAFASIVDVRDLRGSTRTITASGLLGDHLTTTYYEFWSSSCRRVGYQLVGARTVVEVPALATWMTVPGQVGPYHWSMR